MGLRDPHLTCYGKKAIDGVKDGDVYCLGDDEDGDCTYDEKCHPLCLGHHGQPVPCNLCGNPRCIEHDAQAGKCNELCERLNCKGHKLDDDNDLICIAAHTWWCDDTCGSDDGDDEHSRDLGNGVWVYGDLYENDTMYTRIDDTGIEDDYTDVDAMDRLLDKMPEFIKSLTQARDLMAEDLRRLQGLQMLS